MCGQMRKLVGRQLLVEGTDVGNVVRQILKFGPSGPVRTSVASGMQWALWIEVGPLAITFLAMFMMPRKTRDPRA